LVNAELNLNRLVIHLVKKLVCILLLSWLPVFIAAAHAMSMQMAWNQISTATDSAPLGLVTHDCHTDTHDKSDRNATKHVCVACGVCTMSHAAYFETEKAMLLTATQTAQPLGFAVVYISKYYPPAIKPPISK